MKAIILAAGESKRLRPLTNTTPKCLLELDGKAIIDYQIDSLRRLSITDIVVVTGFMAEKLETHFCINHSDINWTFIRSENYQKTYPAHGLWLAKEHLTDDFLYLNADVVCHQDILKTVLESEYPSVTAIQRSDWDEEEVNVIFKESTHEIEEMGKYVAKELSNGEFIGVTKIGKEFSVELIKVLDQFIERKEFKKFAADSINLTIQRGQSMYASDTSHLPAIEIDTPEDLKNAKLKITAIKKIK